MISTQPQRVGRLELNSDAQALTVLDREHKFIINLGGKGSGKTFTHPLWAFDRGSAGDTGQLHGIFTNTERQLRNAVLVEMKRRLPLAGVECDSDRRPPRAWMRRWARENIPIPPLTDYRQIFFTSQGLHAVIGTLSKTSYLQYESLEFASLRIEEFTAIHKKALLTMLTRLRCGSGDECAGLGHRHQAWLFSNPPVGPHPWLYDWLDEWEEVARNFYHALPEGSTCDDGCGVSDGRPIARKHGPVLDHRQWPLLRQGIGNAILIKSATADNRKNLGAGYEADLRMNLDKATARAWLGGEIIREVVGGCYDSFSDANIRPVAYDPDRTLYVCIDINIEPRVAVLAQPLRPGEYPADWAQPGVEQIGIVGEFFDIGPMSDHNFAEALMRGDRGKGDVGYPDEQLRGLPKNWAGLAAHRATVEFYGDADGNRRSAHDVETGSSWSIMWRVFRALPKYLRNIPANNPPARARIHAVNAKLMSDIDKPSLSIDHRARQTIKDCEMVVWESNGLSEREWRQGPEILRTHCMAAVGYMVHVKSPFGQDVKPQTAAEILGGLNAWHSDLKEPRM